MVGLVVLVVLAVAVQVVLILLHQVQRTQAVEVAVAGYMLAVLVAAEVQVS